MCIVIHRQIDAGTGRHQGFVRAREVEQITVAVTRRHRVHRRLERLRTVRPHARGLPGPVDGRGRVSCGASHRLEAQVCASGQWLFPGTGNRLRNRPSPILNGTRREVRRFRAPRNIGAGCRSCSPPPHCFPPARPALERSILTATPARCSHDNRHIPCAPRSARHFCQQTCSIKCPEFSNVSVRVLVRVRSAA